MAGPRPAQRSRHARRIAAEGKPAQGVVRGPSTEKEHLVQFWLKLPLAVESDSVGMILGYDAFVATMDIGDSARLLALG